jgi:hypothetical protein
VLLQCYPSIDAGLCFKSSAAMALALGYVAPTLVLRWVEQRSRTYFAGQLHAAAAHEA